MKRSWLTALAALILTGPPPTKKARQRAKSRESVKARRYRKMRRALAKAGRKAARRAT